MEHHAPIRSCIPWPLAVSLGRANHTKDKPWQGPSVQSWVTPQTNYNHPKPHPLKPRNQPLTIINVRSGCLRRGRPRSVGVSREPSWRPSALVSGGGESQAPLPPPSTLLTVPSGGPRPF